MWLAATAGPTWRRAMSAPVDFPAHVLLIPADRWWTAKFNTAPATNLIYCDVTTVAVWHGPSRVTLVDLDLDVVRRRDTGRVELLDEDEFTVNQYEYGYPEHIIVQAMSSAQALRQAIHDDDEPFGSHFSSWLAQLPT